MRPKFLNREMSIYTQNTSIQHTTAISKLMCFFGQCVILYIFIYSCDMQCRDLRKNRENIDLDLRHNSNHHHPICHNLDSANFFAYKCIRLMAVKIKHSGRKSEKKSNYEKLQCLPQKLKSTFLEHGTTPKEPEK